MHFNNKEGKPVECHHWSQVEALLPHRGPHTSTVMRRGRQIGFRLNCLLLFFLPIIDASASS